MIGWIVFLLVFLGGIVWKFRNKINIPKIHTPSIPTAGFRFSITHLAWVMFTLAIFINFPVFFKEGFGMFWDLGLAKIFLIIVIFFLIAIYWKKSASSSTLSTPWITGWEVCFIAIIAMVVVTVWNIPAVNTTIKEWWAGTGGKTSEVKKQPAYTSGDVIYQGEVGDEPISLIIPCRFTLTRDNWVSIKINLQNGTQKVLFLGGKVIDFPPRVLDQPIEVWSSQPGVKVWVKITAQ